MTRPAVIAGPGSYLPVGKQHALGRGLLGIAVLGHPQVGPADAVAAGDEAAERLGVARLAAHADAADPGPGAGAWAGGGPCRAESNTGARWPRVAMSFVIVTVRCPGTKPTWA